MKTNEQLRKDVQDAINWEPLLHNTKIGVIADDGIVTLTGTVDSYSKKIEAEKAAKHVAGVTALVENIKVVLPHGSVRTDNEVAADVVKALAQNHDIPHENIKVKVENGMVYLEGKITWDFQRESARKSIHQIRGVKGVIDDMVLKSSAHDKLEEKLIKEAFKRHWSLNAHDINVKVTGNHVMLTGYVASMYQKEEAGRIVWKTPGVWSLDNSLIVEHDYYFAG